jgi:very-short-patch-repair endonuclease
MHITTQRDHARTMRKNMTRAERIVWNHLKRRQLSGYRFNRQVEIGPYIVDFLCRECRVVLELDGDSHSEEREIWNDENRTAYLEAEGYVMFRAWNSEVYENLDDVLAGLLEVLQNQTR